jgi:hypothetical protein
VPRLTTTFTRVPRGSVAPGRRLWVTILPRRVRLEYVRLTRPSAQRRDASITRARETVRPRTFGTTQRAVRAAGPRPEGGGGGGKSPPPIQGGVASVFADHVTGPLVQVPDLITRVPPTPRSVVNEPVRLSASLNLRSTIGSGVE